MEDILQKKSKTKRGQKTTNRILEVSADLFAHQGYDNVSVHEIAEVVGIKESSLYNHFESKAEILSTILEYFRNNACNSRPSESETDQMLLIMQPEEIFKNIMLYFGEHTNVILENAAMIINNEKYRNAQAAEIYYKSVVNEPSDYYERLILKMIDKGMLKKVDARMFAEQYNYVSIALTKEYFMAKNGLADLYTVIKYMVKTLNFFCGLMKG